MKAGKRKIPKAKRTWLYKSVSPDGETSVSGPITHEDLAFRWLEVAAVLYCNYENPKAKAEGKRKLRLVAKIMAGWEAAKWDRKAVAKLDRPTRKDPLREKVLDLMRNWQESEFKTFFAAWEAEALEDLRLTATAAKDRYEVDDESGDAGKKLYKLSTLTTMFSEAGRAD